MLWTRRWLPPAVALVLAVLPAHADENLLGYARGAEPLPKGAKEFYFMATQRSDKGSGHYDAVDYSFELEHGFTNKLAAAFYLNAMSIDTANIRIDAYLPEDREFSPRFSGIEAEVRYNFLSPAAHPVGLTLYSALSCGFIDAHSGQDKSTLSLEQLLLAQKYFLDGQLVWIGNVGVEATRATRYAIANLPPDFEWPIEPEMEIEVIGATGLTYRFAPHWYLGVEALYEQENETEVGLERWSLQGGPTLHYGGRNWWGTLTWLPQLEGGGESYPEQGDFGLHLIEKTKTEVRLKVGFNF